MNLFVVLPHFATEVKKACAQLCQILRQNLLDFRVARVLGQGVARSDQTHPLPEWRKITGHRQCSKQSLAPLDG